MKVKEFKDIFDGITEFIPIHTDLLAELSPLLESEIHLGLFIKSIQNLVKLASDKALL